MGKKRDWQEVKQEVNNGNVLAFYSSQRWKKKRQEIMQRDHFQCQRCLNRYKGTGTVKLTRADTVHHDVPLRDNFSLALADKNLISLCFRCHEEIEGRADWKKCAEQKDKLTEERW